MDALKALDLIEQLEVNLNEMYGKLCGMYPDDKVLHPLFSQLEAEELNHANMARMQKRIVRAKPGDFKDVDFNFSDLRAVLDRIAIVSSMPRTKTAEILVQCYHIESSLVEQYVIVSLKSSNDEMRQLLDNLSRGFRDHLTALAAWARELGADVTNLDAVRSHPRVTFSIKAAINETVFAKSVDISESGIFLLTSQPFSEGQIINVSFPIMSGVVSATGQVRYSVSSAGIGVAFTTLSDGNRALIRQYVDACLQKQSAEMRKKQDAMGNNAPLP